MSDFFAAYGRDLHRAARRRIRRARVLAAGTAVAAAAALLAVVVLPALSREAEPEREVAAPGLVACDAPAPPDVLADHFAVFRTLGVDRLPARLEARLGEDLPGGSLAQLWPDRAHVRAFDAGKQFWIVPALRGTCDKPEPVVCSLLVTPEVPVGLPGCSPPDRATENGASGKTRDGRWFMVAAVSDGGNALVQAGDLIVEGDVEDNVFLARYQAGDAGRIVPGGEGWTGYAPAPDPGCGRAVPYLSQLGTPPELIDEFALLRGDSRSADVDASFGFPGVARIFPTGSRTFDASGETYVLLPVLMWNSTDCDEADALPALCLMLGDDGAPSCALQADARRLGVRSGAVIVVPDQTRAVLCRSGERVVPRAGVAVAPRCDVARLDR